MAFNRYYLYSDLMKQLSASQPSEMAVSLVTSSSPAASMSAPSPLKRPADISPLKHIMASGALDLHVQNPVKLLSETINNTLNGGVGSPNGGLEPLAKKLRLDGRHGKNLSNNTEASLNNNAEPAINDHNTSSSASRLMTTQKQTTNLLPGNTSSPEDGRGKAYSCGWGLGNASPIRSQEVTDSSSPQPPTLNPVTPPQQPDELPSSNNNNRTTPPSNQALNSSHHHLLPHLEAPSPLVIKPAMVANSPSRSSTDGEISLENTDPNADPMEGHEVCPECHKVFKRKIYLQRHMEREHWSTAKVFKCEDCNYETKHQSNLSVHRRTHTGERPYHCGACGQRYTQGHLLKSHIRSRHGGNMEFYNLDKKSDSTRGRKSLDIKHDINIVHRQDKISTLLQAAAAANVNQNMQPPKSPFGNLLPAGMPYMNALSPFYGMQANRQLMASPLALGNPLSVAGSNFFTLRGMPNLPSSMLPNNNSNSKSSNNGATFPSPVKSLSPQQQQQQQKSSSNGIKAEHPSPAKDMASGLLMMKEQPALSSSRNAADVRMTSSPDMEASKMSMPVFMRQQVRTSPPPSSSSATSSQPENLSAPEDLSIKSASEASSSNHYSNINSHIEMSLRRASQDLVISSSEEGKGGVKKEVEAELPTDLSRQSETMTPPMSIGEGDQKHVFVRRLSSISDEQEAPVNHSHMVDEEEEEGSLNMHDDQHYHHHQMESDMDTGSLSGGEAVHDSRDTFSPKLISSECCQQDGCQHADQLTKLRKNVMRMLRCFAPEFSENNIDYATKEVDQLLYDVMFSSVDELSRKK